ncbi:CobW family GTP-binding protein [Ensifer soli]|uniref:CobW family GTP-binding protein n=1 Tax=Ciceribacter sp. sgz301302 TaxID=3342379 RepID=UPI0035B8C39D
MAGDFPDFTQVNLLTGFLGSGKTTLLKRLLTDPALENAAVLINEFGEIGLDHHLLERIDETMVLLQSGCLCCTVRGELADAIRDLHSKRDRGLVPPFDRIVIESTGLADPFPVLSTLKADPVLRHHYKAGNVVTTVDAANAARTLSLYGESTRQIAVADQIVLTKADIASPGAVAAVTALVRRLNPDAAILDGVADDFDAGALFSGDAAPQGDQLVSPGGFYADAPAIDLPHSAGVRSFVLETDEAIDWTVFGLWLTMLVNRHGDRLLRIKGILNLEGEEFPVAIHGVQHLVHTPVHMRLWPSDDRRSRLVFIVDGLDPAQILRSFRAFTGTRAGEAEARLRAEG